jgi:hypothetical protein
VVQQLLRPANGRITLDLYAQAGMPNKRDRIKASGARRSQRPIPPDADLKAVDCRHDGWVSRVDARRTQELHRE